MSSAHKRKLGQCGASGQAPRADHGRYRDLAALLSAEVRTVILGIKSVRWSQLAGRKVPLPGSSSRDWKLSSTMQAPIKPPKLLVAAIVTRHISRCVGSW